MLEQGFRYLGGHREGAGTEYANPRRTYAELGEAELRERERLLRQFAPRLRAVVLGTESQDKR